MKTVVIALLVLGSLAPSGACAFDVIDIGSLHDSGVPALQQPGPLVKVSPSSVVMVGSMATGDWVSPSTALLMRVESDGSVAWTRAGASIPWQPVYAAVGADDTVIVLGATETNVHLARFDANGHELWNELIPAAENVADLSADATGITVLDAPVANDSRLMRFSLDGVLVWQASLSNIAGCAPACPDYAGTAMKADPGRGVIVLSAPPGGASQVLEVSNEGTLLWQTAIESGLFATLARSDAGRVAVYGPDAADGKLLHVLEPDGTLAWERSIDAQGRPWDVAFDDADNVYALTYSMARLVTTALSAAGDTRWTDALPTEWPSLYAHLEATSSALPVVVVARVSTAAYHGIAQSGAVAFDTALDGVAGQPLASQRFDDGSIVAVDVMQTEPSSVVLDRLGVDGAALASVGPTATDLPVSAGADGIAWHDDGSKTILAASTHAFLAGLDRDGAERWRFDYPQPAFPYFIIGVPRAAGSDVLVATVVSYAGQAGDTPTTIQRRSASGAVIWEITQPLSFSDFIARADGSSDLLASNGRDLWRLDHRDAAGMLAWSAPLSVQPSMSSAMLAGPHIVAAGDGGASVFGTLDGSSAPFVERFDANGVSLWHRNWDGWAGGNPEFVEDENGIGYLLYSLASGPIVLRALSAGGDDLWSIELDPWLETLSENERSLIAARGGGVLLTTLAGVHRISAAGDSLWMRAHDCPSGCLPVSIRQRADGHVFALSTWGTTPWGMYYDAATEVVELDASGNFIDEYRSQPIPHTRDVALDLRTIGGDVDVADLSVGANSLVGVRLRRLRGENVFADGFDAPP